MIRARSGRDLILGLDAENIRLLKAGNPIKVEGKTLNAPEYDIYILYGETLDEIAEELNVPDSIRRQQ